MIYTNSTTNYTNIDTQKSVHFAVSRTETRLKMHQTFGFEGRLWDLIVSVPDHCLSFYFVYEILVICRALQAL